MKQEQEKQGNTHKQNYTSRAVAVDAIAADNLLEQMNKGGGVPDSLRR
ncbi:hypothetical protein Q5H92_11150 [Hymenobacter sp. M29]|uniref:Uncharacterized protein n=1 Tax=Hymenobacter mellowenesis TaxID=3063995 RepID=A0ABT9AAQ2_9BACT|nr:hypothetical protein [Hymenobacter sp. M29]MDO7846916.1 hypothetical protein [Hymenobacter sp. M29]